MSPAALRTRRAPALRQFLECAVLPEDVTLHAEMAADLWDVTEPDAAATLRVLAAEALLEPAGVKDAPERTPLYRLHDLLLDAARTLVVAPPPRGLGTTLAAMHATVIERYRRRSQDGRVAARHEHVCRDLTWHMEQAGQMDQVHALLSRRDQTPTGFASPWYEARPRAAEYRADVERAWRDAEQSSTRNTVESLGLQLRYALVSATLATHGRELSPFLVRGLIQRGVWTPELALDSVREMPDPFSRTVALARIAGDMPEPYRTRAFTDALRTYAR